MFPETCIKRGLTSTQPSTASDISIQSDNSTQNDSQDQSAAPSALSILLNFRDKGAYEATGPASGGGQRAEGHVYQRSPVCSNDEFHETITVGDAKGCHQLPALQACILFYFFLHKGKQP